MRVHCFRNVNMFLVIFPLTLVPQNKLSSAKYLVCFNVHIASKSLKVSENAVCVSNNFDLDDTPSESASHPQIQAACI